MKKITKSMDGIPRFTLKLEARIGAYDMAVHVINKLKYRENMSNSLMGDETMEERDQRIENRIKYEMSGMSDQEILEILRDSLISYGDQSPYYQVSDEGYSKAVDFLTGYFTRKYKGFQKVSQDETAIK